MNTAQAAALRTALAGIPLPAAKPELLEFAVHRHAEPPLLDALRALADERRYGSLDEVVAELLRPRRPAEEP